jgi:hypothetical protein
MATDTHSIDSSLREKILEHLFVGELLRHLWCTGRRDIEVLRVEVDRGGYDLALECNGMLRHVQFKASFDTATTRHVDVNVSLAQKPSSCVIWIRFDPATMALGPFYWFGGEPGMPMPDLGDRIAKHAKADSTGTKRYRPGIRTLSRSKFQEIGTIAGVAQRLFDI